MLLKFIIGLVLCLAFYWFNHMQKQVGTTARDKSSILIPPDVEIPLPKSRSLLHVYKEAAICSDEYTCSNMGSLILQQKGNAIDAAIETLLCNGLVTMQSMGIGGGVIMNFYIRKENKSVVIIGRERAPINVNLDELKILQNATAFATSALSIAVPGELSAYYEAHRRYGDLPWLFIMQPILKLCHRGYRLTAHQYDALYLNERMIRKNKLLAHMFIDSTTNLFYKKGWHIKFPSQVCATYKLLAEEGPLTFYNGSLSSIIISDLKEMGSSITMEDLKTFRSEIKESLKFDLDPYYIYLPQPPASGNIIGLVIKYLQRFQKEFSLAKDFNALQVHRIVEALKFGFVKRWQYDADVDYKTLKNLFKPQLIDNLNQHIDDYKTFDDPQHYGHQINLTPRPDYGTAHISVLAPNGDAVSATSTINYYFGSGHMGNRSGVLFNNAMADFTVENFKNYFNLPNVKGINEINRQKHPMSSMAPLIVTSKASGDVQLVVGAAGGSRIISTLVQILVRVLWQRQTIKEAIDAPRFHHQLLPNSLKYEFGMLDQVVQGLKERGHKTQRTRRKTTIVCGVQKKEDGVVLANADYRKGGAVDGF